MSRTLYAKFTDYRNDRFRIVTKLTEEDGERHIVKESAPGAHAEAHLRRVADAAGKIADMFQGLYRVCPCTLEGTRLVFPYVSGTPYQAALDDAVLCGDPVRQREALEAYMRLVEGPAENACEFRSGPEFEEVFGAGWEDLSCPALRIANLDASGSNFLVGEDGGLTLIDYEWTFAFPVPRDFVLFRNLRVMFDAAWTHRIRFDTLLSICGIVLERDILEKMALAFSDYVCTEGGLASRGTVLAESAVAPIGNPGLFQRKKHYVFFDSGSGFAESDKLEFDAANGPFALALDVAGAGRIRFDPFAGAATLVRGLKCTSQSGADIAFRPAFGTMHGDELRLERPANLHIVVPPGETLLRIEGDFSLLEPEEAACDAAVLAQRASHFERLAADRSEQVLAEHEQAQSALEKAGHLEEEKELLLHEKQELAREVEILQAALGEKDASLAHASSHAQAMEEQVHAMRASNSWKLTKWLRRLRGSRE